ncbi:hypothetical protein [Micromonospora sp. WMMD1274]|uniref:hypothetical protein n=1 Tax=Micromonospora sp. WMMD1274 TaxID=3404116 RepID=UPI003B9320A1
MESRRDIDCNFAVDVGYSGTPIKLTVEKRIPEGTPGTYVDLVGKESVSRIKEYRATFGEPVAELEEQDNG